MKRAAWFNSLLTSWNSRFSQSRRPRRRRARPHWSCTSEQLEERTLLSAYVAADVSSLIADINAANKAGGANTITLTAPTTAPYVLSATNNTANGANGLPVLGGKNAVNLTIIGNGDTIERSTGAPAFRLFDVAGGSSLTLENLTLQNGLLTGGSGPSAEGGAIYNQGTLVLSGVTVQDNEILAAAGANATKGKGAHAGSDAAGGGIWSDGLLTLENGTAIENNSAVAGGGGAGSSADRTVAAGAAGGNAFGGGLYVAGGAVNVSSATVSVNATQGGAGGVGGWYQVVGINRAVYTYYGGSGTGGNASGGALYVAAGQVAVTGASLDDNSAQGGMGGPGFDPLGLGGNACGGGICVAGGSVTLSGDSVDSNSATGGVGNANSSGENAFGGGIYVAGGSVSLSSDTVEFNSAVGNYVGGSGVGGGIYVASGTVTLSGDTVEFNTAQFNTASGISAGDNVGGGIYIATGTVYIDTATVASTINNTDDSGLNGSTANIDGSYTLQNS